MSETVKLIEKMWQNKYQFISLFLSGYPSVCMCIASFGNTLPVSVSVTATFVLILSIIFAIMAYIHNLKNKKSNPLILAKDMDEIPKFNAEFYLKLGHFTIFSRDLHWVTDEEPQVMPILLKKASAGIDGNGNSALTIWVKAEYINTENVQLLKNAGADVQIIPEGKLGDDLIFSIREHGNDKESILQHRFEGTPDTITVHKLIYHAHIVLLDEFVKSLKTMPVTGG